MDLYEVVKSRIPLIRIRSEEGPYTEQVLLSVLGSAARSLSSKPTRIAENSVYYWIHPGRLIPEHWLAMYSAVSDANSCIVLVNPQENSDCFYDAGKLSAPRSLFKVFASQHVHKKNRKAVLGALRDLSYKRAMEYCRLALASSGELTASAIRLARGHPAEHVLGLQSVSTGTVCYVPPDEISWWVKDLRKLMGAPVLLRPRGALFTGASGTGKTMAAKYVAREIGVPLYLLELGVVLSKWHGETDQNFYQCLECIERASPCVFLVDEVEKLFITGVDDRVVSRLLAKFLWWLQEHGASVLTLMTTNDPSKLPSELYRKGRMDHVVMFHPIKTMDGVREFANNYLDQINLGERVSLDMLEFEAPMTRAEIVDTIIRNARDSYLQNQ